MAKSFEEWMEDYMKRNKIGVLGYETIIHMKQAWNAALESEPQEAKALGDPDDPDDDWLQNPEIRKRVWTRYNKLVAEGKITPGNNTYTHGGTI